MLNRALVFSQLQTLSTSLFADTSAEYQIAQQSWQRICADPLFVYKVRAANTALLVPDWSEVIGTNIKIENIVNDYSILGIDGSQIYPDRHQGTSCFLVNIGSIILYYGICSGQRVLLNSQPYLFTPETSPAGMFGPELVDCLRQELELEIGLALSKKTDVSNENYPFLFLFDGSIIFWHLASKENNLKEHFLNKYLLQLDQLFQARVLNAGYISLPKSKELVNLVRLELSNFKYVQQEQNDELKHVSDTTIASFFLEPHCRTICFKSNAEIGALYPDHLRPYFFYLNVGTEIARVEIPEWIALAPDLVETVARIILNQCIKGKGYPVALAEAHEQAVVKGPDRDFFYHVITKLSLEKKHRILPSQKSLKKKGIAI